MQTAATKWKEFKADLKREFLMKYNDDMEEDQLLALCDERVHEDDWKWLLDHWRSPEAIAHSLRAKSNRSKLTQNHTSGSKSHARVENELREELGRSPRRDEVFIKSHTHKTGEPHRGAEEQINALKAAVTDHPEWTEKSIQEGDVYFRVCGPEKNGYVRVVGLGPSPADLEMQEQLMPSSNQFQLLSPQQQLIAQAQTQNDITRMGSPAPSGSPGIRSGDPDYLMKVTVQSVPGQENSQHRAVYVNPELEGHEDDDAASNLRDGIQEENLSDYENIFSNRHVVQQEEQHQEGGKDVTL